MNNQVKLDMGCGDVTYTKEELVSNLHELMFFRDAFLLLLNPEVVENSDLTYSRDDVFKMAEEMYLNSGYSKDFIKAVFSQK